MKTIYAISGSAGEESSNRRMLQSIAQQYSALANWQMDEHLLKLPLYRPSIDQNPLPESALAWRKAIAAAGAVIICTPEYLHNIPAVLKNGLEWLKSSGEFYDKPVLPITFTPHEPRGEYAMSSMCNSLLALKARVVVQLPLYRKDFQECGDGYKLNSEQCEIIEAALELLGI